MTDVAYCRHCQRWVDGGHRRLFPPQWVANLFWGLLIGTVIGVPWLFGTLGIVEAVLLR